MTSSEDSAHIDVVRQVAREMRLMSSFDALFSQAVADRVGVHSTDIETLDLLNVLGPMTAGRLSQLTGLSTGATTRLVDRLVRAGFVRREPDDQDRRRVIIAPVPENLGDVSKLYVPLMDKLGAVWASFSDEELTVILRFARSSNNAVSEANAIVRAEAGE
ncbi:MAG TPA: MarR family transcriptional regulator [Dehalococcoidia bacterium]|nr:MarR family transcriptional regulator [Dehalococcoidia bacterium]